MEQLRENHTGGLGSGALRALGLIFLAGGVFARCLIQRKMLGVGTLSAEALLAMMEDTQAFWLATSSLLLQALEACAIPIFALLLVEGFEHTSSLGRYFLRLLAAAVLSEIPYDLAMSGKVVNLQAQNPMFGLVIALAALYLFRYLRVRSAKHTALKIVIALAGLLWPLMLNVEYGIGMVAAALVLWVLRGKPLLRNLCGIAAMAVCSLFSPFLLASSLGFLAVHFYNGQRGDGENRYLRYGFYPALLLAAAVAMMV